MELSREEARNLLNAPATDTPQGIRDRAILALIMVYGLEPVGVERLDVGDIDLTAGTLQLPGRGTKRRKVSLIDEARDILKTWLSSRSLFGPETPAVFINLNWSPEGRGERTNTRSIRRIVDKYLKQTGAKTPGVSCRTLRYSLSTPGRWVSSRTPPPEFVPD